MTRKTPKDREWETFRRELAKEASVLETTDDFDAYERIIRKALEASRVNADLDAKTRSTIAHAIATLSYIIIPRKKAVGAEGKPPKN